jgi:uncharacterized membrane protein
VIEHSEQYISVDLQPALRSQALRVWMIGGTVALIWVLLIVLPAVAKANGLTQISTPLYSFFSLLCHQMPARSFHIEGEQFGVCSRCFGVYPLWRRLDDTEPISRIWLFLALVPITIDWSLTIFGIWENTHLSRFITGLLLGAACATFIVPAIVEITKNVSLRSRIKKAA